MQEQQQTPQDLAEAKALADERELQQQINCTFLPAWAVGVTDQWTQVGAQLCTRNGTAFGNGVLADVRGNPAHPDRLVYQVITDIGTALHCTEEELKRMFHQPKFLMDPQKHPGVRRYFGFDALHAVSGKTADELWKDVCDLRQAVNELQRRLNLTAIDEQLDGLAKLINEEPRRSMFTYAVDVTASSLVHMDIEHTEKPTVDEIRKIIANNLLNQLVRDGADINIERIEVLDQGPKDPETEQRMRRFNLR